VRWSSREPGVRFLACLSAAALACVGCSATASQSGSDNAATACGSMPPVAGASHGLSGIGYGLSANASVEAIYGVSGVPGTRQAWALGGRYGNPDAGSGYLLHFTGLDWAKAASFGPQIHLEGVSAISGTAAWVWGQTWPKNYAPLKFRPFLALVSDGVVTQMHVPSRWWSVWTATMTSNGAAVTWLSGLARDRKGRWQGPVLARWDGTSWHAVPVPPGNWHAVSWSVKASSPGLLSTTGPSDLWAAAQGRVWHWNGSVWSTSYEPSASIDRPNTQLVMGSIASSGVRAWVVYDTVSNADPESGVGPPTRSYSAYFDGRTWHPVPVSKRFGPLTEITMSGADAWVLTGASGGSPVILHSHGGGWCAQPPLPWRGHRGCSGRAASPTSISAASLDYVIAVGGSWQPGCAFAYVYDGHMWRAVNSLPVGRG
jgi:hypothetical protein